MIQKYKIIIKFLAVVVGVGSVFMPVESRASGQAIYVIERPDGSVTFTSRRPTKGSYSVLSASNKKTSFSRVNTRTRAWPKLVEKARYNKIIDAAAVKQGVDPHLVKAVIQVESSYNPNATSNKGAMGLMQLMPDTAKSLGVKNPYQPEDNIKGGVKFLRQLLDKYDGNIGLTLAAYNAGEYSVEKHGGIPPFKETIQYVRKVVELRQQYKIDRG